MTFRNALYPYNLIPESKKYSINIAKSPLRQIGELSDSVDFYFALLDTMISNELNYIIFLSKKSINNQFLMRNK